MRFQCTFDYYPMPWDAQFYLRSMRVDVRCPTEDDGEVVAARLAIDHLDLDRAIADGMSVYDVCDADSAGWEAVFAYLFEPGSQGEWRKDLDFDEVISNVLFLWKSRFHPKLLDWRPYILHHAAGLVGDATAFVMWQRETDLSDKQLSDLGFCRIAGSGLLLRPNMLKIEYTEDVDRKRIWDLRVPEDAEKWVESEWGDDRANA